MLAQEFFEDNGKCRAWWRRPMLDICDAAFGFQRPFQTVDLALQESNAIALFFLLSLDNLSELQKANFRHSQS